MIFAGKQRLQASPETTRPGAQCVVGNRTLPVNLSDTSFARFWLTSTPFDYRNTEGD